MLIPCHLRVLQPDRKFNLHQQVRAHAIASRTRRPNKVPHIDPRTNFGRKKVACRAIPSSARATLTQPTELCSGFENLASTHPRILTDPKTEVSQNFL